MPTLNEITTQVDSIKIDIVTCHTNLKNNLVAKGVSVLEDDKMPSLVSKVGNINAITDIVPGDKCFIYENTNRYSPLGYTYDIMSCHKFSFVNSFNDGGFRFAFTVSSRYTNSIIRIVQKDTNDTIINYVEKSIYTGPSIGEVNLVIDFLNLKKGNTISVYYKMSSGSSPSSYEYISNTKVTCDIQMTGGA